MGATMMSRLRCIVCVAPLLVAPVAVAETIEFGFGTDKPPYVYENEGRGLEYDIVQAAMREAGISLNVRHLPIDRLHLTLEHGELDAIASTNIQSGLSNVAYSDVVLYYQNVAIALASRGLVVERIEDLSNLSVSSFQSARRLLGGAYAKMAAANPRYREEPRQITRSRLLYSGRVDVVVADIRIHEQLSKQASAEVDVSQPITVYPIFPRTPYRIGFRDAELRDRFNRGLAAVRASGEYAAIEERYASDEPEKALSGVTHVVNGAVRSAAGSER